MVLPETKEGRKVFPAFFFSYIYVWRIFFRLFVKYLLKESLLHLCMLAESINQFYESIRHAFEQQSYEMVPAKVLKE